MRDDYRKFLEKKSTSKVEHGFKPLWLPDCLFDFQKYLTQWAVEKGRCAIFADCGLGKSVIELVYLENVVRKTNRPVLLLTPLAVVEQMIREARKFGIEAKRTKVGEVHKGINVTNYERLHYYNPKDFAAVVGDESGCIKNFDGKTRKAVTEFMSDIHFGLLATATPAPNDFMELGTSSEALGEMGRNQMLGMFFTNDGETTQQWRLKGHAKQRFWQWMATWSRAIRKPSDLGDSFDDTKFQLPPLKIAQHVVPSKVMTGFFATPAKTLDDQRLERNRTIHERCGMVAKLIPKNRPSVVWCHLNPEGDLLKELIPGAVQVSGADKDEVKEERFLAFADGQIRTLITKPKIGGWGLNWQHCADVFCFPSHSHEAYYQTIRRCWRFGQKNEVNCNLIYSEAEKLVLSNMLRKERQADEMYAGICREMNNVLKKKELYNGRIEMEIPKWLQTS